MLIDRPGSKEIQRLIEILRIHASELRSRGVMDIADNFDSVASSLVIGPAGEIPLCKFSTDIHHQKGYIDELPSGYSRAEWVGIVTKLQKLTMSALMANGWSFSFSRIIKRFLWPF